MVEEIHVCTEKGCIKKAIQCHLVDYGDYKSEPKDVFYWYCSEHAGQNGFCCLCGEFWQGNGEFDLEPSHLCPNCINEVDAETIKISEEDAELFE